MNQATAGRITRGAGSKRQGGAGDILRGGLDPDMGGADFREGLGDDAMGQFRPVTIGAEVAEVKLAQLGRDNLPGDFSGSVVGKVAVPAEDALLDAPRAFGGVLQQLEVMVGFWSEYFPQ